MIDWLIGLDKEIFLFFNGMHSSFGDAFMVMISGKIIWSIFYLGIVIALFKQYGYRKWLIILLGIGLTITFCDQFASGLMKPFFQRFRPSHDPTLSDLVHLVNGKRGGKYGFASSHAANAFGLAMFICSLVRNRIVWVFFMFWACLVSYSRVYLGVHFPGDIFTGAIVGLILGRLVYLAYAKVEDKWTWLTEKVIAPARNYTLDIPVWGMAVIGMMLLVAQYVVKGV
ncbi:MAG: phosphatase PAP2 family protein [Marinifilaceae bacterium]|jgi:undecaprenyl-diphosphatase